MGIYGRALSEIALDFWYIFYKNVSNSTHYFLMKHSGCLEDNKMQISTEFRKFLSKFKNGIFWAALELLTYSTSTKHRY